MHRRRRRLRRRRRRRLGCALRRRLFRRDQMAWGRRRASECIPRRPLVSFSLEVDQTGNAALIAAIAHRRGLPARSRDDRPRHRAAGVEVRNISHGDLDSVGLFQQRLSQGWGARRRSSTRCTRRTPSSTPWVKVQGYRRWISPPPLSACSAAASRRHTRSTKISPAFASALTGTPRGIVCRLEGTRRPQPPHDRRGQPADPGSPASAGPPGRRPGRLDRQRPHRLGGRRVGGRS